MGVLILLLPEAHWNWAKVWKIQNAMYSTRPNDLEVRISGFYKLKGHGHILTTYCENWMGERVSKTSRWTACWRLPSPQSSSQFLLRATWSSPATGAWVFVLSRYGGALALQEQQQKKSWLVGFADFYGIKIPTTASVKLLIWCYSTPSWDEKLSRLVSAGSQDTPGSGSALWHCVQLFSWPS